MDGDNVAIAKPPVFTHELKQWWIFNQKPYTEVLVNNQELTQDQSNRYDAPSLLAILNI